MSLIVIASQNLSPGVRGALTKWMLEIGPGTFVGDLPKRIASELWTHVDDWCEGDGAAFGSRATFVQTATTEQGYVFATSGNGRYIPVEHAGLWLVERSPQTSLEDSIGLDKKGSGSQKDAYSAPEAAVPW